MPVQREAEVGAVRRTLLVAAPFVAGAAAVALAFAAIHDALPKDWHGRSPPRYAGRWLKASSTKENGCRPPERWLAP